MGLIERIKSALGLGASSSTSQPAASSTDGPSPGDDPGAGGGASGDGVDVTVEHEPATASEDAVKGTDTATEQTASTDTGAEAEADTEVETEADTEVETEADTEDAGDAEAEGDDAGDAQAEADDAEADAPTDPAPDAELEDIKGIGPTYAERLREAGVDGVGGLAGADPAALAEETDIAESRVENWVEQAKLY
ncbi:helix-hairpin-helix domain-containing protein [Halosimplex marinum]|uniref:helix-hairpin-helix domain-containing protein n=1 Tax=Halosimplex marinum TaxID=3396620 RepID=UPI003F57D3A7